MPVYNAAPYVGEAIRSVLEQSFVDWELIVVDDGSTDNTLIEVNAFRDERIMLIKSNHDFVGSLNLGLEAATGSYIARMDADDRMHPDRLRIQHAIMEEEPAIVVCCSRMILFGENVPKGAVCQSLDGLLEYPLFQFLKGNMLCHPTAMLRARFLRDHSLRYEKNYPYAEDYKLWTEIAKCGGTFYVEAQPLLYYRVSSQQVSSLHRMEQMTSTTFIKNEILGHLTGLNEKTYPSLAVMLNSMRKAVEEGLLSDNELFGFYYSLFMQNKNNILL